VKPPGCEILGPRHCRGSAHLPEPFCLLCCETKIAECHRKQIADRLIRTRGGTVHHLE
jgi:hypothetical protein